MELVVKVIGKDIQTKNGGFTAYSFLSIENNWFRTAGIDVKELEAFRDQVAVAKIRRMFTKKVDTKHGEMELPTLVVDSIENASKEQIAAFNKAHRQFDLETLKDVR